MEIYLGTTLISCLIYWGMSKLSEKKTIFKIFISLLPIIIVVAIRYDIGWDYLKVYSSGFFVVGNTGNLHHFTEVPFNYLIKIIFDVSSGNPDWLFIVCSIITFAFVSKALKDQSVNIVFSILLIFLTRYYFITLSIVRQAVAMSIILCSYKYIKERNPKKYILTILLASCFHMTALIYIPIYLFYKIDWKKKKNSVILIILIILTIPAYFLVMKYTKYGKYIGSVYQGNQFLLHELIISGVILFIATFQRKHVKIEKEYFDTYYILQIVTFILSILSRFLPSADRIIWLFYGQNILFIPLIIRNVKKVNQRMFLALGLIVMLFITVYCQTIVKDSFDVIPYKTIFEK